MERRPTHGDEVWLLSYADLITNLLIFFVMLLSAAEISRTRMQKIQNGLSGVVSPTSLKSIQAEIESRIEEQGLQELITTELTDDGQEQSLNSGVVFDTGEALVLSEVEGTLGSMLEVLVEFQTRYRFAIEGHTDSRPIGPGGRYRSNWELSTARANAVRERLETVGVAADRIRVEGYADTRPLPEDSLAGLAKDQRLALHRRVIVRVH